MPPQKRIRGRQALADALHVSVRTIRAWIAAGLPEPKRGWLLDEVRSWRAERLARGTAARAAGRRRRPADEAAVRAVTRVDRAPPDDPDEPRDAGGEVERQQPADFARPVDEQLAAGARPRTIVLEQEARRRYWLAERERIAAQKESGELVDARQVTADQVRLCAAFRRTMLEFCRHVAPSITGLEHTLEVQRCLEREAEAALTRIQQMGGLPA